MGCERRVQLVEQLQHHARSPRPRAGRADQLHQDRVGHQRARIRLLVRLGQIRREAKHHVVLLRRERGELLRHRAIGLAMLHLHPLQPRPVGAQLTLAALERLPARDGHLETLVHIRLQLLQERGDTT